jgi:hypothetical protein
MYPRSGRRVFGDIKCILIYKHSIKACIRICFFYGKKIRRHLDETFHTTRGTWPLLPVHYRLYVDVRDVEKTTTMYEILAFGTNTERNCDAKICEGLFTIEAIAVL